MIAGRRLQLPTAKCRLYATAAAFTTRPVPILSNTCVDTFRREAFDPATPALFPRGCFANMPAVKKWFIPTREAEESPQANASRSLNRSYLARFGATRVPLEISHEQHFMRIEQSLSFFLSCVHASSSSYHLSRPQQNRYFSAYHPTARPVRRSKVTTPDATFFTSSASLAIPTARVYLAQAALDDLPTPLRDDVPAPPYVQHAGTGDVYASALWLGEAPTYTPLHRDPNPNVFVQLAGRKVVRILRPEVGRGVFAKVQEQIRGSAHERLRGEEMMSGGEKEVLEQEVWGEGSLGGVMMEVELDSGDGLFIPKGWWHSVKGVGEGHTVSCSLVIPHSDRQRLCLRPVQAYRSCHDERMTVGDFSTQHEKTQRYIEDSLEHQRGIIGVGAKRHAEIRGSPRDLEKLGFVRGCTH
nr:lysine-specific demethylase jmj30 [Quercus suber]